MKRVMLLIGVVLLLTGSATVWAGQGLLERALEGGAAIIDLTYPLNERTQVWPGGLPFMKELIVDYDKGYRLFNFTMAENVGTHVDAPAHFIKGGISIDQIPLTLLIGPAVVLNAVEQVTKNPDYLLTVDDLDRWEKAHGRIPQVAVVLMYTGWGARWNDTKRYRNMDKKEVMHFPGFSAAAARFLVQHRKINGIGIDTLSLDHGPSTDFPVHKVMLSAGKYQIENLADLDKLPPRGAVLFVLPIKVGEGSQAEARVIAIAP
ncbi:MAG: cyclase family protein [Nitrospiria bacterium]